MTTINKKMQLFINQESSEKTVDPKFVRAKPHEDEISRAHSVQSRLLRDVRVRKQMAA